MSSDESYDHAAWLADRDALSVSIDLLNEQILVPRGFGRCTNLIWLQGSGENAHFVNKVFKVELGEDSEHSALVLKLSHPFWNGTGKCLAEVRALKFSARHGLPCPDVLAFSAVDNQAYRTETTA